MGADPHSGPCRRAGVWRERLPRVARRLGHSGSSLSGEPGPWWAPVPVSPSGKRELRKQSDADRQCRRAQRRNSPVVPCRPPAIVFPMGDVAAKVGRTWFFPWIELSFAQCPSLAFRIARRLAETVARESGGRLRLPPPT